MKSDTGFTDQTFPAVMDSLEPARLFVTGFNEEANLPPARIFNLELALEEILVNVINYAYPDRSNGTVTIGCSAEIGQITVSIRDQGKPFDPLLKEEPDLNCSIEERPIGGLGIFLTREMVDEIHYEHRNGFNITTFTLRSRT
jgi:anti-sigma regulatory factor (Ser/Thr protein kinase)